MVLLISASLFLSGCGAETEEQALITDEIIIEDGLAIINEYENVPVKFYGFKQLDDGIVPVEIIDKFTIMNRILMYHRDNTTMIIKTRMFIYLKKVAGLFLMKIIKT